MSLCLWIAGITVVLFIASILFCPAILVRTNRRGDPHFRSIKIYPFIPLAGAAVMTLTGCVSLSRIADSFLADSSVNPIRILILFLSMTVFSLILDQTGFFGYVSGVILQRSGGGQYGIFLTLYAVISLLTMFTSNDIVILTFTPFICYFCRSGKINPVPYLIMEFVAANTWSLFFLIGNPTNIYISGAFGIDFSEYLLTMALPTLAAGIVSLGLMLLLFGRQLKGRISVKTEPETITNYPLMWISLGHLIACVVLLALSGSIGFEMWLISLMMGISCLASSVVCLAVQKRKQRPVKDAVKRMPFEIIPFVIGMFVLVLALELCGVTEMIGTALAGCGGAFSYGILSFFASNVLNNIPMSVLFSRILGVCGSMEEIFATIVGSNIGAFLTPVGALAGIMWFNLLKQHGVKLSVRRFVLYGFLIGIPTLLAAVLVLGWIS